MLVLPVFQFRVRMLPVMLMKKGPVKYGMGSEKISPRERFKRGLPLNLGAGDAIEPEMPSKNIAAFCVTTARDIIFTAVRGIRSHCYCLVQLEHQTPTIEFDRTFREGANPSPD